MARKYKLYLPQADGQRRIDKISRAAHNLLYNYITSGKIKEEKGDRTRYKLNVESRGDFDTIKELLAIDPNRTYFNISFDNYALVSVRYKPK